MENQAVIDNLKATGQELILLGKDDWLVECPLIDMDRNLTATFSNISDFNTIQCTATVLNMPHQPVLEELKSSADITKSKKQNLQKRMWETEGIYICVYRNIKCATSLKRIVLNT